MSNSHDAELYLRTVKTVNEQEIPNETDFAEIAEQVFTSFKARAGRSYKSIERSGSQNAEITIVSLGSGVRLLQQASKHRSDLNIAVFNVRLYRPWSDKNFLAEISPNERELLSLNKCLSALQSGLHCIWM
jgi:pyruvate-ferredoxin/flavodoxin oxidoreductase